MIEQALYEHLRNSEDLARCLTKYDGELAVFNQEAPSDMDELWAPGPQYGRLVFAVDLQGDPERTMGGILTVDIMCKETQLQEEEDSIQCLPEEIEPIVKSLIHGYFFSNSTFTFTVAAQWKNSSYFTEPTEHVIGCTVTFDLLGFPVLTTPDPDIVTRINRWTSERFNEDCKRLHVINYDELPAEAWRPSEGSSAVYWRLVTDNPANWIPDTFQTIWRTATLKCHIFSEDHAIAATVARILTTRLYAEKRILKCKETPIMVNRRNTVDIGADPLRTGQVTVEATYGIIVHIEPDGKIEKINY